MLRAAQRSILPLQGLNGRLQLGQALGRDARVGARGSGLRGAFPVQAVHELLHVHNYVTVAAWGGGRPCA